MEFTNFKTFAEIPLEGKLLSLYDEGKIEEKLSGWLPMGWSIRGTNGNATFGYHIEFDIDHLPTPWECAKVKEKLKKANEGIL